MNIDELTDIAYEVADELEPGRSFDVFDVSETQIIFQSKHGLFTVKLNGHTDHALREAMKKGLKGYHPA